MVCTQCGHATQVINSRLQKRANSVWRRRRCLDCNAVFTTHEVADYTALWRVIGKNPAMKPFNRDELLISLYKSLQHRPQAISDAAGLTDTLIIRLTTKQRDGLINVSDITQQASAMLDLFDTLASSHYRAFHKQ